MAVICLGSGFSSAEGSEIEKGSLPSNSGGPAGYSYITTSMDFTSFVQ